MLDDAQPLSAQLAQEFRSTAEALDRGERGPKLEIELLHDNGLLAAPLPSRFGGAGWGTEPGGVAALLRLLMAIGAENLSIARLFEGHVNAVRLVVVYGDEAQRNRVFEAVRQGAMLGVWGADSSRPVVIDRSADKTVLTGKKAFASGLGVVALAIVTAKDASDQSQMVLVRTSDTARQFPEEWDVSSMVASCSGGFDCTNLEIQECDLIGAPGALFLEPDFHGGIWRICACYAGAMRTLVHELDQVVAKATGEQVAVLKHRLGHALICARSAELWARDAADAAENAQDVDTAVSTVLFAREAIEQQAAKLIQICERIGGTSVHRRTSRMGRIMRDLQFYLRQAALDAKLEYAVSLAST